MGIGDGDREMTVGGEWGGGGGGGMKGQGVPAGMFVAQARGCR